MHYQCWKLFFFLSKDVSMFSLNAQFKRRTFHVLTLIPSIKYMKISFNIWTNNIKSEPRIKIEWRTWEFWLWSNFVYVPNLMHKLLKFIFICKHCRPLNIMKMNWLIKFDIWINIELVSFGANLINQVLSSIHEKIDIWTGPKLFNYIITEILSKAKPAAELVTCSVKSQMRTRLKNCLYSHRVAFLQTYCPCHPTHSKILKPSCPTPETVSVCQRTKVFCRCGEAVCGIQCKGLSLASLAG